MNINTKEYWEKRFSTGDWEAKLGRNQTRQFALAQVRHLKIPSNFSGMILDFGCGLGDAMPVYQKAYRYASLIGMDISEVAIAKCKERYGNIAKFIQGDYTQVPEVDVIIASNVLEHLSNDIKKAKHLLSKCKNLYIIVPYKETLSSIEEHINSYDENYFRTIGEYDYTVFPSKGWSRYGWHLWYHIRMKNLLRRMKNLLRPFFGKRIIPRWKQIMFHFLNDSCSPFASNVLTG